MGWFLMGLGVTLLLLVFIGGSKRWRDWVHEWRHGTDRSDIPIAFVIQEPDRVSSPLVDSATELEMLPDSRRGDIASATALPSRAADSPPALLDQRGHAVAPPNGNGAAADMPLPIAGPSVTYHRADRTMRLLPGRLEIEEGEAERSEIRFVHLPGAQQEVTFGRRVGEPFRHIELHSPTVSRDHARMARVGSDWVITNLSNTNPIVVNGASLTDSAGSRVLRDGDRIEMGEVVFRYHST
jgi:hypothetical protein